MLGCKHRLCASFPPLPDGKPDRAGKTCNISHWLLGCERMMRRRAGESEWSNGGINEKGNRRTHQGALQFWRALICSDFPLLPQSPFLPFLVSSLPKSQKKNSLLNSHSTLSFPSLPDSYTSFILLALTLKPLVFYPVIAFFLNLNS